MTRKPRAVRDAERRWFAPDAKTKRFDASGHQWALSGDVVDIFAYEGSSGYHNGPRCTVCGYEACWHCKPNPPKCLGKLTSRKGK